MNAQVLMVTCPYNKHVIVLVQRREHCVQEIAFFSMREIPGEMDGLLQ